MTRTPPQSDAETAAQIEALRAELRQLAETVLKLAEVQTAGLSSRIQDIAETGRDGVNAAKTEAQHLLDETTAYARAEPMKALGIAALLGMLFGLLFGRR